MRIEAESEEYLARQGEDGGKTTVGGANQLGFGAVLLAKPI